MSDVPVFPLINSLSPSIAALGDPVRVYPDTIPQRIVLDLTQAAVTYSTVTGHPEDYIDAPADLDSYIISISIWAMDPDLCKYVADQVRIALENGGKNCLVRFNPDDFEPETQRYRLSFDFEFWVTR